MHAQRLLTIAGGGALLLASAIGGFTASAQEATPASGGAGPHPLHIHTGNCDELGAVVAPLTDLVSPEGDRVGQRNRAAAASTSYTSVPLTLDAILADDHAINAHLSAEQIDVYIACGEIGGTVAPDGSLTIGLRELNDSSYTGIAYLAPGADGASTDVTVFLAETQDRNRGDGDAAATGGDSGESAMTGDDAMTNDDMDGDAMGEDAMATPDTMDDGMGEMDMSGDSTPAP